MPIISVQFKVSTELDITLEISVIVKLIYLDLPTKLRQ